jgi:peptide/nickel transport system permease protein
LQLGAWWWFIPPGVAVALMGTALVLLNTGIDEFGNPRLRDASNASRIAGHLIRPTDPTPVLLPDAPAERSKVGAFLHSFSRNSFLEDKAEEKASVK